MRQSESLQESTEYMPADMGCNVVKCTSCPSGHLHIQVRYASLYALSAGSNASRMCCNAVDRCNAIQYRKSLIVGLEKSDGLSSVELIASLEEGDLEHEEVADEVTSELLHERASGLGRTTCDMCVRTLLMGSEYGTIHEVAYR